MEAYYGGVDAGGRPLRCGRGGRSLRSLVADLCGAGARALTIRNQGMYYQIEYYCEKVIEKWQVFGCYMSQMLPGGPKSLFW